jgi:hypothetical protein
MQEYSQLPLQVRMQGSLMLKTPRHPSAPRSGTTTLFGVSSALLHPHPSMSITLRSGERRACASDGVETRVRSKAFRV